MTNPSSSQASKALPASSLLSQDQAKRQALAQDLIGTLEELILAQKKLNYFSKELKVWSTPKRNLPQI